MKNGIAIPHGLNDSVIKPTTVYGYHHPAGVKYEAMEDNPIQKIFMIAVLNSSGNEYLAIISEWAAKLIHEDFIKTKKGIQGVKMSL